MAARARAGWSRSKSSRCLSKKTGVVESVFVVALLADVIKGTQMKTVLVGWKMDPVPLASTGVSQVMMMLLALLPGVRGLPR